MHCLFSNLDRSMAPPRAMKSEKRAVQSDYTTLEEEDSEHDEDGSDKFDRRRAPPKFVSLVRRNSAKKKVIKPTVKQLNAKYSKILETMQC